MGSEKSSTSTGLYPASDHSQSNKIWVNNYALKRTGNVMLGVTCASTEVHLFSRKDIYIVKVYKFVG